MIDGEELSNKDNLKAIWGSYGPLICEDCKLRMEPLGQKIADRLNDGKQPRIRDVIKLQNSLCKACYYKVYEQKVRGEHGIHD